MKKINYRPVYNRKGRLNEQGTALLQIEAYMGGKKIYFTTHIYLKPKQWDTRRLQIKNHPHAEALNFLYHEFVIELERKELDLWKSGHEVTLDMLREEFCTGSQLSFLNFVAKDIESAQIKDSTKINRKSTYALLSRFHSEIDFKDINARFVYDFEKFLFSNNLHVNTVAKHMKHLKSFVNSAINKGYIKANDYPFRRYRIKTSESKHTHLLPDEVQRLEELVLTGRYVSLQHTLDAFLFCCYTGLRYSDFNNMSSENITTIDGKPWLVFQAQKTGTQIRLPLGLLFEGKAWNMLRKYRHKWDTFFRLRPNSTTNKELIRIGQLAGIKKHFSFHSSRHTNATLLIYRGANITTVQKLLGHRNIATTQIYSEVMGSTIVRDLEKCAKENRKTSKNKGVNPEEVEIR